VTAGDHEGDGELQALVTNQLLAKTIQVGHIWKHDEAHDDVAATCSSTGVKYLKCSECGKTDEKTIPKDGNAHGELKLENVKEATCTEKGYTGDQVCSLCGKVIHKGKVTAAKGHTWIKVKTGDSSYDYVCSRCGKTIHYGITQNDHGNESTNTDTNTTTKSNRYIKVTTSKDQSDSSNKDNTQNTDESSTTHQHVYEWAVDEYGNSFKDCTICHKRLYPKTTAMMNLTLNASSNKIKIRFKKIKGATQYTLYRAINGTKFKKYKTLNRTSFTDKKLKNHTIYGYMVVANDSKKTKSLKCYSVTGNMKGKQANVKKLVASKNVKIIAGKKKKLKVKVTYFGKKKKSLSKRFGNSLRYASNETAIATVNKDGVVTGVREGHCNIYVYGQNGVYKSVSVTVI
jgi:DNA-directed RNA polymerase subunit RPC12/RpoP